MVQQKIKRECEIEKFSTFRTGRKYMICLEGPHGEVKSNTEKGRPSVHVFIRVQ